MSDFSYLLNPDLPPAAKAFHYTMCPDWESYASPVAAFIHHACWGDLHVIWDKPYADKLRELIKKYPLDAKTICTTFPGMYKMPCI